MLATGAGASIAMPFSAMPTPLHADRSGPAAECHGRDGYQIGARDAATDIGHQTLHAVVVVGGRDIRHRCRLERRLRVGDPDGAGGRVVQLPPAVVVERGEVGDERTRQVVGLAAFDPHAGHAAVTDVGGTPRPGRVFAGRADRDDPVAGRRGAARERAAHRGDGTLQPGGQEVGRLHRRLRGRGRANRRVSRLPPQAASNPDVTASRPSHRIIACLFIVETPGRTRGLRASPQGDRGCR